MSGYRCRARIDGMTEVTAVHPPAFRAGVKTWRTAPWDILIILRNCVTLTPMILTKVALCSDIIIQQEGKLFSTFDSSRITLKHYKTSVRDNSSLRRLKI